MSLFPDDRELPADALDSMQVKLSGLELRRPRIFGNCWLACELWQQLGLDEFWQQRLPEAREAVSWEKVLRSPHGFGKVARLDHRTFGHHAGMRNGVFQFPNVSRPSVGRKQRQCSPRKCCSYGSGSVTL